jgi:hypothetical protein
MELVLTRDTFSALSTIGTLHIDGVFECDVLEDTDRYLEDGGTKILKETAIPRGRYLVVYDYSGHFKMFLPHVLGVPQYEGIRFHIGNRPEDTEGCLLVGFRNGIDWISYSGKAFDSFLKKLKKAWNNGEEVWLTVQ